MASPSTNEILTQIGLHNGKSNGRGSSQNEPNLASQALIHLIESGKLSIHDAKDSVNAVKTKPALPNETNNKQTNKKGDEKFRTRHVALQFSYDGTDYTGFAQNIGKEEDKSVEKALFAALEKTRLLVEPHQIDFSVRDEVEGGNGINGETSARTASKYSRCGRTDKGVHANGQVVALYLKSAFPIGTKLPKDSTTSTKEPGQLLQQDDLPNNSLDRLQCFIPRRIKKSQQNNDTSLELKTINEYDYPRILNNVLPPSIRILGWCPVSSEFSARFSCSNRTYRYFFPRRNLDLNAMAEGLQCMMGKHDFRNLCKMNCEQVYNFERVMIEGRIVSPQVVYSISEESIKKDDVDRKCTSPSPRDMCYVEIIGQAFLWHQIRCIMSILFMIGRKLETPLVVQHLLDIATNPSKPSYDMASENALVLHDCTFANLSLGRSVRNLWDVTKVLETTWEKHALGAGRVCDLIETVRKQEVRWTDVVAFVQQIAKERRRKEQKRDGVFNTKSDEDIEQLLTRFACDSLETEDAEKVVTPPTTISWEKALNLIEKVLNVYPHLPNGVSESTKGLTESTIHTPLMERARGTTYEEKVRSILGDDSNGNGTKPSKRRERYEENVIKKRKTAEEDKAFYDHKLKQGGSSV